MTPTKLFFDLVFVFVVTQVTHMVETHPGWDLVVIIGVILVAAGITDAIHHFNAPVNRWWLGCGTAVFLLGHASYRAMLRTGRITDRLVGAVCAVPLGAAASFAGWAGMTAVGLVLAGIATVDHRVAARLEARRAAEERPAG